MRILLRNAIIFVSFFGKSILCAEDGPIDWEKAPSGGPSALRNCAQWPYTDCCNNAVHNALGCKVISCVCRADLIKSARQHIKDRVAQSCGKDATVDTEMALKIYDEYCAYNGYPVPGFTLVLTKTAKISSGTAAATASATEDSESEAKSSSAKPTSSKASSASSGNGSTITSTESTTTDTEVATSAETTSPTTATDIPLSVSILVVTATAVPTSSAPPRLHSSWLRTIAHFILAPIEFILALPETLIVTITPSQLPPAVTSEFTTLLIIPTAPEISTKIVEESPTTDLYNPDSYLTSNGQIIFTTTTGSEDTNNNDGNDDSGDIGSQSNTPKLSKIEVAGIAIGIVVGLITTIATVWMCATGRQMLKKKESPEQRQVVR